MEVICHKRNDPERGLTDPVPELNGRKFIYRIYSGDICDPVGAGNNWFKEPFPTRVWRTYCKYPILPFIAWVWPAWMSKIFPGLKDRVGYMGFKLYGVDSPEYKKWPVGIKPEDVYDGSQAVCLSIRPFARGN